MTTGLLEMFSNTDWGKRLKEEKDKILSSAIMSLFNPDFKVPISTQTDITPTFQSNVDQFKTQPSGAGLGFLDASTLKSLFQPPDEEERKKSYKQAALTMIGSALGGALAKALGASDEFAAGMTGGGYLMGQKLLEEQLEKEKAWQNFKNKLVTELAIKSIEYAAERAKDELTRNRLRTYYKVLEEKVKPKYCRDDGSFDWLGFIDEAARVGYEMKLKPKEIEIIQKNFVYPKEVAAKIEKIKAQILENLYHALYYGAQAGTEEVEKNLKKAQTEKIKKETGLLGKPQPPKVIIYHSEGKSKKTNKEEIDRRLLEKAISLAQKDPRWTETTTDTERWALVTEYFNKLQNLLQRQNQPQPIQKKLSPTGTTKSKITGDTLYKVLFGE